MFLMNSQVSQSFRLPNIWFGSDRIFEFVIFSRTFNRSSTLLCERARNAACFTICTACSINCSDSRPTFLRARMICGMWWLTVVVELLYPPVLWQTFLGQVPWCTKISLRKKISWTGRSTGGGKVIQPPQ